VQPVGHDARDAGLKVPGGQLLEHPRHLQDPDPVREARLGRVQARTFQEGGSLMPASAAGPRNPRITRSRYSASARRRYRCTTTRSPPSSVTMSVRFVKPHVARVASDTGRARARAISSRAESSAPTGPP
jgi:hypothetical protein